MHQAENMKSTIHKIEIIVLALVVIAVFAITHYYYSSSSLLQQVKSEGEIIIITRNSPSTYYIGNEGPTGFEYELAEQFAEYLGVRLAIIVQNEFHQILPALVNGKAHIGAAGITHTRQREAYVDFGPDYHKIVSQVAYRGGQQKPKTIEDLQNKRVAVIQGSTHAQMLLDHKEFFPLLDWNEYPGLSTEDLIHLVSDGLIDYTIADSNELALNRRYFPKLRIGFNLGPEQSLAWAFQKSEDTSLQNAAKMFFAQISDDGTLAKLKEKYFGHVNSISPADSHAFIRNVKKRLPKYERIFKEAALEFDVDWRFLAAVSYQESLWNSNAISPTGVKGLMMLTRATAKQLNIENRVDPLNSVLGGTEYYLTMREKIPARIADPDRTWFALAAYNVGFGHLEDARILTQRAGGNPDLWLDVRKYLPLLSKKKWYEKTRFGYARGQEPVVYVQNIRNYFDLLVWLENKGELYELFAQNT